MAAEQAALRRRIAEKRRDIAEDIERLNRELRHDYAAVTSPERLVRQRPLIALGAALAVGSLIGSRVADLLVLARPRVHLFENARRRP
jgi:ElaB/YqjD/DUF883 family membrane-anchored ribosome-binding protein